MVYPFIPFKKKRIKYISFKLHLQCFISEEGCAGIGNDAQHGGGEAPVESQQALLPPDGEEHGHQRPVLLGSETREQVDV
jgi:hypothetical protein